MEAWFDQETVHWHFKYKSWKDSSRNLKKWSVIKRDDRS